MAIFIDGSTPSHHHYCFTGKWEMYFHYLKVYIGLFFFLSNQVTTLLIVFSSSLMALSIFD